MSGRKDIKNIPLVALPDVVKDLGFKPYVANQLIQWLYQKGATSFDEMTNISKAARETLAEYFYISRLNLINKLESQDGTQKFAWRLSDGNVIESVLIPSEPYSRIPTYKSDDLPTIAPRHLRTTLCISTQVGCAMGCTFCRTAKMGFVRNLKLSEILDQVIEARRIIGRVGDSPLTNIVFMGMGEPLANLDNVANAVKILSASEAVGLAKRRITISTAGLVPAIDKLAKLKLGIKFAVSLNATTDEVRDKLMPVNKRYPISVLMDACKRYVRQTGRYRMTFEYVMFSGVNDSIDDAKRLVKLISHIPSKVNLIPFNPYSGCEYKAPDVGAVEKFADYLRSKHFQTNIRAGRGQDIMAACGQLAGQFEVRQFEIS